MDKRKNKVIKRMCSLVMVVVLGFSLIGCKKVAAGGGTEETVSRNTAKNLMENVIEIAYEPANDEATEEFLKAYSQYSIDFLKNTVSKDENTLVSPMSVMIALTMTGNGADKNTLAQIEAVFGGISISDINNNLPCILKRMPNASNKFKFADSIWFRKCAILPNQHFLAINKSLYNAQIYEDAFDKSTVDNINAWVKENTDGMIPKILDEIEGDSVMYLINTVVFDGKWQETYEKENVHKDKFTQKDGSEKEVDFMYSTEYSYLEGNNYTGFSKDYKKGEYSFVALLPNEGIGIDEFVESLGNDTFYKVLGNAKHIKTYTSIPKFQYDYSIELNDTLKKMGMTDAFIAEVADFSKMTDDENQLFIGSVKHKTFIDMNENGTIAAAVTSVDIKNCTAIDEDYRKVFLNRPFVYAIIEKNTGVPIFMGTMINP